MPTLQRPAPYTVTADSLGWLVVGASTMAERQMISAIRHQPARLRTAAVDSWVVGLHSHQQWRAQQMALRHHIPHASDNLRSLLQRDDVRCVYIGNHPRHHAECVRAALIAGKHVLCEPPLAAEIEEAQALAALATQSGLLLGLNFSHRCNPALQLMRQWLAAEEIGDLLSGQINHLCLLEIAQQTWRIQQPFGGVLQTQSIFGADLLCYLLNDQISEVRAISGQQVFAKNLDEDVYVEVRLLRKRMIVQIHDSFLIPHAPSRLEIYGTEGTVVAVDWAALPWQTELQIFKGGRARSIPVNSAQLPQITPFSLLIAQFHQAVRGEGVLPATASDGIQSMLFAKAASETIRRRDAFLRIG